MSRHLRLWTGMVLAGLFLLSPLQESQARKLISYRQVAKDVVATIKKRSSLTKVYKIFYPSVLKIKVIEVNGRNIEFKVLRNGKLLYRSGKKKGSAFGKVLFGTGQLSLQIINGHLFRKKVVSFTIQAFPAVLKRFYKGRKVHHLTRSKATTIPKRKQYSIVYKIHKPGLLLVRVRELFNKNIKFKVLFNGKVILNAKKRKGRAVGTVRVGKGTVTVQVINGHLFRKKSIVLDVALIR